jgi:hypothetical protein
MNHPDQLYAIARDRRLDALASAAAARRARPVDTKAREAR